MSPHRSPLSAFHPSSRPFPKCLPQPISLSLTMTTVYSTSSPLRSVLSPSPSLQLPFSPSNIIRPICRTIRQSSANMSIPSFPVPLHPQPLLSLTSTPLNNLPTWIPPSSTPPPTLSYLDLTTPRAHRIPAIWLLSLSNTSDPVTPGAFVPTQTLCPVL